MPLPSLTIISAVNAGSIWVCLKVAFMSQAIEIVLIVRGITRQRDDLFQKYSS